MRPTEFISAIRKGKIGPAYFFRGPDRFLHEECRAAVLAAIPSESREWCLEEIEFEAGRLQRRLEGANQLPMLGGRLYLLFSDPEDFRHAADEDHEALSAYLDSPSPFSTVVFAAAEPDRRRRFIQLLEKKAAVVEMRALGKREAAEWVRGFLERSGVGVKAELADELAAKFEITSDLDPERAGVNLLWLRTELEKVLTARPGLTELERSDLELVVAFREEHQIGALLRSLADRKCNEALVRLRDLLASKTPETLLLWCIGDLVRQALKAQPATKAASSRASGWQPSRGGGWARPGGPYSAAEAAASMVRNYSQEELVRGLRLVRQTDLGIKSSWKDSRLLLEYLVWQTVVGAGQRLGEAGGEGSEMWRSERASPGD